MLKHFALAHDALVAFHDTAQRKPHPAPLIEAANRLAIAPVGAWAIGDTVDDITAARAAGMLAVAVTGCSDDPQAVVAVPPDLHFSDLDQLMAHLSQ